MLSREFGTTNSAVTVGLTEVSIEGGGLHEEKVYHHRLYFYGILSSGICGCSLNRPAISPQLVCQPLIWRPPADRPLSRYRVPADLKGRAACFDCCCGFGSNDSFGNDRG